MLLREELFSYTGFFTVPSRCRVRLFLPPQESGHDTYIVLYTDDKDAEGTSITNAAEALSIAVCQQFNLPSERAVFVEHYDFRHLPEGHDDLGREEDFSLVSFAVPETASGRFDYVHRKILGAPQWKRTDKQSVEILIGEPLP